MIKLAMAFIGLGGMAAAAPAQAAVNDRADLDHAKAIGTIEALEDVAWRHPGLRPAIRLELARFECAMGQQWRCGADSKPDPEHRGYGG